MTKMLKFIKPHSKVISPERLQKQKELFGYTEGCYHGFPAKPSALAWDPKLQLFALATRNGHIRVFGKEGVEFHGKHESESVILKLCFIPGKGALVSLSDDNCLQLWKLKEEDSENRCMVLVHSKTASLEGKLKRISTVVQNADCTNLLVGTEGGNIYILDFKSFTMTNDIIYQDVVMQNVPEDFKLNPGAVEVIAPHPTESNKILIGYQRGLIVLWDRKQLSAEQTYVSNQQLESICWNAEATEFVTSHNDGSYVIWSVDSPASPKEGPTTVYGPYPCKPINKIVWKHHQGSHITVFGGGMPRANYGDRHTVTVMRDDDHVTLNLTSRVIDFVVTEDQENKGDVSTLIVLTEEEAVFVDLSSEGWPVLQNPYLCSLHSSAVTCSLYVSNVDEDVLKKIKTAGEQSSSGYSSKSWPIMGGVVAEVTPSNTDILLTGHEDGTVRFWDSSSVCLSLLYKLNTAPIFVGDDLGGEANAEDDDWPPFRKVGLFDPYSDDPRLAVKKLEMCAYSGRLVVAGTAGQVIVFELGDEEKAILPECVDVNLVAETDSFVWKSHSRLDMTKEEYKFASGMQPVVVVQFFPPASCTSLNMHSEWGLLAAGTAHGFALFDYVLKKNLLAKSTLSPMDLANAGDDGPLSRRKSLKKSLRESFRRLRRGRSQKKPPPAQSGRPGHRDGPISPTSPRTKSTATDEDGPVRSVERSIEARTHSQDYLGSMVRCLHLTKCYIASTQLMSATLWAGTNGGAIYIFTIAVPPAEKRLQVGITVQLGKEIHLKHAAPVINITILDSNSKPFPEPMAVQKGKAAQADNSGPHRVLITSEEQFKIFTLPQLRPFCKFKLTAQEGSRVRKMSTSVFASSVDKSYKENCIMVATNLGDLSVYSLPEARKQVMAQCMKREDISGIGSVVFSRRGEALFAVSPSELCRVSLSAAAITRPRATVAPVRAAQGSGATQEDSPLKKKSVLTTVKESTGTSKSKTECSAMAAPPVPSTPPAAADTTTNGDTSILSGDLTIDSIRDHLDAEKAAPSTVVVVSSAAAENVVTSVTTTKTSSETGEETRTIVKTSQFTVVTSQEANSASSSVQVVETAADSPPPAANEATVNGTAE